MKKVYLLALASAIIASITVFFYVQSNENGMIYSSLKKTNIIVANIDISKGTIITSALVSEEMIPIEAVNPTAITDINKVIGMVATNDILSGEQINSKRLGIKGEKSISGLSYELPKESCAMTVPVDENTSVGNNIQKGDKVDVIQILSKTISNNLTIMEPTYLLHDIQVIRVGTIVEQNTSVQSENPSNTNTTSNTQKAPTDSIIYKSVTLVLTSEQALNLNYAIANGSIKLVLKPAVEY